MNLQHKAERPGAVPAPGRTDASATVVQVRLSGDLAACDVLAAVLASYPGVHVAAQSRPRRNRRDPGHRIHLTLRLDLGGGRS